MTRQGNNPASLQPPEPPASSPKEVVCPGASKHQPENIETSKTSPDEDKEINELVEKMIANRRRRMKRR